MEIIKDIKQRGIDSAYIIGPFDQTLKILESQGYKLISLEDNAGLRIQEGKNHDVSKNGNRVKEGVLHVPGEGRFITRHSPVLDNPRKATQAQVNGKEYFMSNNQVRKALEDSVYVPYDVIGISTEGFGEDAIAIFCFGKNAKDYGLFLKDAGIYNMPIWLADKEDIDKQKQVFTRQLWLDRLDDLSVLNGDYRYLHSNSRSRGAKLGTEGTAQN